MNYLVDPTKITKFGCSERELQLLLLFWVCAAGKKASTASKNLQRLLDHGCEKFKVSEPFEIIRQYGRELSEHMRIHGIGCYNNKSSTMLELASSGLNLSTCSVSELESVKGIGPKTSRCFIMHSRKGARHAGLDTHVLKYLREMGLSAPKSTPQGKKYLELEDAFLRIADELGKSPADLDLEIWNRYSSSELPAKASRSIH